MKNTKIDCRSEQYLHKLKQLPALYDAALPIPAGTQDDTVSTVNWLVLGPSLHAYVLWILSSAIRDGVERLYFLSRDGFLPYRIAQAVCERLHLNIDCRYFYCSRAALRIPMYHLDMEDTLEQICRGGLNVTPCRILLRAGLSELEAKRVFPSLELPYAYNEPIPYAEIPSVRKILSHNEPFLQLMCRISESRFPALKGYFQQEGILDRGHFAVVDSGWTGTMQRSIRKICEACGGNSILTGYYFGLFYLPKDCNPADYRSFYFGPYHGLLRKVFFNNNLFEVVYSAPHGTVLEYESTIGGFSPSLCTPDLRIKSYIDSFTRQLDIYTDKLITQQTAESLLSISEVQLRRTAQRLLCRLMWAPTRTEAETFGTLPFSDDLQDAGLQDLALKLDHSALRKNHILNRLLVMLGLRKGILPQSAWYEGSAVRSAEHSLWHRISFSIYKLLLYLRRR